MERKNLCVHEALLYSKLSKKKVKCGVCERRCVISPNQRGFCKTRENRDGKLFTLVYGDVWLFIEANPIEKKPFFHFWPGSYALTVGTWSCNFTCPWCQNWHMTKTAPDPSKASYVSPEDFVKLTKYYNCQGTSISFNEPTLLFEYSLDVFRLAKKEGLYNTFVTNGYMTLDVLNLLAKSGLDAMNIDVKGDEEAVRKYCNGVDVKKIWRNIEVAKKLGIHVEITTLVIPGVNDDKECLEGIASKAAKIDRNMPWHVTQYYPAYKALEIGLYPDRTPIEILERAWKIGRESGLNYVYVGNIPGHRYENTYCHNCNELLIERYGFEIVDSKITSANTCPKCGERIPIIGKVKRT